MITNTNKKVICIKEIPSNLIEEAFFILKTDIDANKDAKRGETKKKIVLQEAKDFLCTYAFSLENERRHEELFEKNKKMKLALGAFAFGFICLLVSVIICA